MYPCWLELLVIEKDGEADFIRYVELPFAPAEGVLLDFDPAEADYFKISDVEYNVTDGVFGISVGSARKYLFFASWRCYHENHDCNLRSSGPPIWRIGTFRGKLGGRTFRRIWFAVAVWPGDLQEYGDAVRGAEWKSKTK